MIKYPNGKVFVKKSDNTIKRKDINSANRGMDLESDINLSNEYYLAKDIALISKRPTPINVVKVDYTKGAKITDAYFEKQSTTDYNGVYHGKYLDFEAKNTNSKTSFPLANIYKHQITHLENVIRHGGIAFFIINFHHYDKVFLLDASYIIEYVKTNKKKSISYDDIKKYGHEIPRSYNPRIDYLKVVKEIYKI